MSYQVLARKWRPQLFSQLVGQEHVVRALANALDNDRLHHAYLFTGTRGVGKTTLARIFAKSLNCEEGVSSTPCGVCSACREIDEGRFVDLLEVDAASRTKVDQTRELLENVPYAPVRGRYKVYLIDEVHMFSASSFNALLKTLEEPPPHVKFILATTDPQKVPVTVLSRCLQFNLKRLSREQIGGQLSHILGQERIGFDDESLSLLSRGADGSMRDGLSLLDQAIAFGGGALQAADVGAMLGTIAGDSIHALADALAGNDAAGLLQRIAGMSELAADFATATQNLLALLHQIALCQLVPDFQPDDAFDVAQVKRLAQSLAPEDVQLYYQIGLSGQRELSLAPDPRSGFEMLLLRMLAFRPEAAGSGSNTGESTQVPSGSPAPNATASVGGKQVRRERAPTQAGKPQPAQTEKREQVTDPSRWDEFAAGLRLGGIASQLANNCAFAGWDGKALKLKLDPASRQLRVGQAEKRLLDGIRSVLGAEVKIDFVVETSDKETPAMRQKRNLNERQQEAEASMAEDPLVRELEEHLSARVVSGSVKPVD
ncbi:MAG: DNA polymerase III subunit gamma/tau [Gammaproteobacteria bacterium (ex Lamellibrachia satsuma)]|nr:MAG: DNA polymerase III subunit gamma/tau [Gammaproteobacteria bacterium (ex Lamellibrachia satsuma)]RRS32526.1 MAG: DNA polymerase III subunit gamma/tau [Gammaproteobacteria bacterium (ex Lamellibrachia satsuma)]RRS36717.1 MAG: DNA polymerase III subunit gamma/tau [Gammaproteobacteria bacterium (ex Lamellibrachia satsuma)]